MALERDDGGREPRGNERIRRARAALIGVGNVVHVCPRRDFRSFNKQQAEVQIWRIVCQFGKITSMCF